MRSEWVSRPVFDLLLTALMPENRLALLVSEATGLRITDVLHLRPEQVAKQRFTVTERKTHKRRRVYLPQLLQKELLRFSGRYWCFPGRLDETKPRSRQAVYKDIRRVSFLYRVQGERIRAHISPHTARKVYAVEEYHRGGLKHVQELLQHDNEAVTMLYALADKLARAERFEAPAGSMKKRRG